MKTTTVTPGRGPHTKASLDRTRWTPRPVATVTGLDVFSPLGLGREEHWAAALEGRSGLAPTERFDSSRLGNPVSGEIRGFDPAAHLPGRLLPATDRMTQMSLVVADAAIADSQLDPEDLDATHAGVVTAATAGGYEFGQRELENLWTRGPRHISTHQSYAWFYAVNTGQISIRHGYQGHSSVIVADSAGGLDAIAIAARRLERGNHVVLTGAVDSAMCPWGRVAQTSTGLTSPEIDPAQAYLPFDRRATGWVHGEGGAHLVVQPGPRPGYGVLAGHGATVDIPGAAPQDGLTRAARIALHRARLRPHDIDVVFADAAGDPARDHAEAAALSTLFGPTSVPVTAPKVATGRLGSGGPPVDVAMALLALRDQVIPPTIGVSTDPALDLNLCLAPHRARLRTALVLARGIGGFNSALVIGANSQGD